MRETDLKRGMTKDYCKRFLFVSTEINSMEKIFSKTKEAVERIFIFPKRKSKIRVVSRIL